MHMFAQFGPPCMGDFWQGLRGTTFATIYCEGNCKGWMHRKCVSMSKLL